MYSRDSINRSTLESFHLQGMITRYSVFVPRLYNLCLSLGFTAGKIMPSRAFCSDESQGFPTILLAKHFGAYPFNHGQVGGVVATDRHGPHANHGKDLVLIQASHVGYDPDTKEFGEYRRIQSDGDHKSTNCGKILATLDWYEREFSLAKANIILEADEAHHYVVIDKELLRLDRKEGLVLNIDQFMDKETYPDRSFSTSSRFVVSDAFVDLIGADVWKRGKRIEIGEDLLPQLFHFRRSIPIDVEGREHLEQNLINAMPWILTSEHPALTAAKVNTQVEFDRTYRTILREPAYRNKNFLFIAGIHIDISPQPKQVFPLTKFIPWAAYHQTSSGEHQIFEQAELNQRLQVQSVENPSKLDLEEAIRVMEDEQEVLIDAL